MEEFKAIRELFKPIQPTIKGGNQEISYQEIQPDKEIENFIYCFWQLRTNQKLKEPFVYRVVSDGCIDIFFEQENPSQNFVMGFFRKYTEFPIGKTFNYIGIRFLPSAFSFLFGIDVRALSNTSQALSNILPEFSAWISQSKLQNHSFRKITEILNREFEHRIRHQVFDIDFRFFDALILICKRKGFLDIEKDLHTGLSPRQLRRIFNYYIGTTPKAFSNVVRFQYILHAKPSLQSLKENKLYYDVGFFDQAHFIKNFKTFYGITPNEAFR